MVEGLAEKQEELRKIYREEIQNGRTPKDAAKIAQQRTGLSIRTGLPVKSAAPQEEKSSRLFRDVAKRPSVGFGLY